MNLSSLEGFYRDDFLFADQNLVGSALLTTEIRYVLRSISSYYCTSYFAIILYFAKSICYQFICFYISGIE